MTKSNPIALKIIAVPDLEIWFTDEIGDVITQIGKDTPFYIKCKLNKEPKFNIQISLFYCEDGYIHLKGYTGLVSRTDINGYTSFYLSSGIRGWNPQYFCVMACMI